MFYLYQCKELCPRAHIVLFIFVPFDQSWCEQDDFNYMVNAVFYFPYIAVIYFYFLNIGLCGLVHIYIQLMLYCAVLIWSVVSNPLWPHGLYVACQAPLSMGIFQARILEWLAMPTSRASSQPRDQTQISRIASGFFSIWATRRAHTFTLL